MNDNIEVAKSCPAWNPGCMVGLFNSVKNHAPWDYKRQGRQYEDFGNFNYGAVTEAMMVSDFSSFNAAGIYQQLRGASGAGKGVPILVKPYGDDPADALQIELGRQYVRCNCK
ncbi:polymorphic toxin type 44 domain-containing protein [Roseateles chitinivorans]|uniref:polymorphic toxin type 44 domain-containing protein n=1 Tax=Roseateles chitinivorans TaxID=2917965 RepID=UPI003D665DFD